jgi:hypothetical protein
MDNGFFFIILIYGVNDKEFQNIFINMKHQILKRLPNKRQLNKNGKLLQK